MGPSVIGFVPLPVPPGVNITGVTRDSTGAALGNCEVELYMRNGGQTAGTFVARTTSDGSGNFTFRVGPGQFYQHIAYQVGSPDKAGISTRTVVGA